MNKREQILELVKGFLHGPLKGKEEILEDHPLKLYCTGILFPRDIGVNDEDDISLLEESISNKNKDYIDLTKDSQSTSLSEGTEDDESVVSINRKAFYHSSIGISFLVSKETNFEINLKYETYSIQNSKELRSSQETIVTQYKLNPEHEFKIDSTNLKKINPVNENEKLVIRVKTTEKNNQIFYTIFFINNYIAGKHESGKRKHKFHDEIIQMIIFRPKIKIGISAESLGFLPLDLDSRTLYNYSNVEKMLYRKNLTYSKGHNTACFDLIDDISKNCISIENDFLPEITFPILSTEILNKNNESSLDILKINNILNLSKNEVVKKLNDFSSLYSDWIKNLTIPVDYTKEAKDNIIICESTYLRIKEGIKLLENDEIFEIWRDANYVINEQFLYSNPGKEFQWRPFQIGFFLLSIPGLVDPFHTDRIFADLLWVTTGGGKTEAYLGLIAFTVFYRRWKYKKKGLGLSVISRYTLRLLTAQQFERTSALVCAMELLRQSKEKQYGKEEIILGLFVGGESTPNKIESMRGMTNSLIDKLKEVKKGEKKNPFILKKCPKCKSELYNSDGQYELENSDNSFLILRNGRSKDFIIRCLNTDCVFHTIPIPVDFVDESLMKKKPAILISTIDKLAMIPFKAEDYKKIFMAANCMPVDLIIQDELHLINSTLGSIFGSYESAIHMILENSPEVRLSKEKYKIKIIASTATPKNAEVQIGLLFNRKYNVFPPNGTDIKDSFFTRFEDKEIGRKYLGFLPTGIPQKAFQVRSTSAILIASAIVEADFEDKSDTIFFDWKKEINQYYRLLTLYFNAIRVLGGYSAMLYDDIAKMMEYHTNFLAGMIIKDQYHINEKWKDLLIKKPDSSLIRPLEVIELTGRAKGEELSENLKRVSGSDVPDVLLSTNMISVGIDIENLNQMVMIGQPKYTSEYIQATSRTGRKPEQAPGIVYISYNTAKIRDLSFFEYFYSYHKSIYKYIEPITVTPFSLPVLERTLHSLIVSIVRFLLEEDEKAQVSDKIKSLLTNIRLKRDTTSEGYRILEGFKNSIKERLDSMIKDGLMSELDKEYTLIVYEKKFDEILEYITDKINSSNGKPLHYAYIPGTARIQGLTKVKEKDYLIQFYGNNELEDIEEKFTKGSMTSMRNVSQECQIRLYEPGNWGKK